MMDKKTYNQIHKEIDRLAYERDHKAVITKRELVEKVETVGFHEFRGTGEYVYKDVAYPDEKRIKEINERIAFLKTLTKDEDERRAKIEAEKAKERKRKRYIKELAELKDRQAYIERWLEEN